MHEGLESALRDYISEHPRATLDELTAIGVCRLAELEPESFTDRLAALGGLPGLASFAHGAAFNWAGDNNVEMDERLFAPPSSGSAPALGWKQLVGTSLLRIEAAAESAKRDIINTPHASRSDSQDALLPQWEALLVVVRTLRHVGVDKMPELDLRMQRWVQEVARVYAQLMTLPPSHETVRAFMLAEVGFEAMARALYAHEGEMNGIPGVVE